MITKAEAILSLQPNAVFTLIGSELIWKTEGLDAPTEAEIEAEVARLIAEQPAKEARAKRNRLLTDTDWVTIRATDTGDPVPSDWQTYRQALRDITEQTGFPEEIEWPQEPES